MELNFDGVLLKAGLIGVRVGGLMTFAPFFSSIGIPARVKVGLSVAITAILYPIYGSMVPPIETLDWIQVIASEVLAGLLLGLTLQFVFDGARLAGQTVGFQMGFSLANLIDPQSQVNTVVLSIFYQLITLFFFLQLDVHHWVIRGLAKSFVYLPAGTARATPAATEELLRLAGGMWLIAVQIAAPVLVATFLADVALGFMGKASPQMPILFMGLSVKNVIGTAVMLGSVKYWPAVFEGHFLRAVESTERLLHLAR